MAHDPLCPWQPETGGIRVEEGTGEQNIFDVRKQKHLDELVHSSGGAGAASQSSLHPVQLAIRSSQLEQDGNGYPG